MLEAVTPSTLRYAVWMLPGNCWSFGRLRTEEAECRKVKDGEIGGATRPLGFVPSQRAGTTMKIERTGSSTERLASMFQSHLTEKICATQQKKIAMAIFQ